MLMRWKASPFGGVFYFYLMRWIVVIFLMLSNVFNSKAKDTNDIKLIPIPTKAEFTSGTCDLYSGSEFVYDSLFVNEVALARDLFQGKRKSPNSIKIVLTLDSTMLNKEAYSMKLTHDAVLIKASSGSGAFYALQSLHQLSISYKGLVPCMLLEDSPRFEYRGMHLDVGRHFYDVERVKQYIDLLAFHKFNAFHWHLTEDQGWRIEIKKYPLLTAEGSVRKGTAIGLAGSRNAPYSYDTIPYGGFYTQEEIREVVQYASERHITVVPEIELPGHCLAALAAYPEMGNGTGPYEVAKRWGIFKEVFAPKDSTFIFIADVLNEVMDLFPGPYIHIGGDEVKKDEWKASSQAQDFMKVNELKNEEELQSYFIKFAQKVVHRRGRSIIGWDEILEGGIAPDALVMSWRGKDGGIAAAKAGHNVIMTPITHCYFDLYQVPENKQKSEPLTGSKKHISVQKVYEYEPIPSELSLGESKFIIGAQGNVWTEYLRTWDLLMYRALPRMTALSEVLWSAKSSKDWVSFKGRLESILWKWDYLGYNYAKHFRE